MIAIIIILCHLTGSILSYILMRHSFRKYLGEWTKGDRVLGLTLSLLFGWIGVIGGLCEIGTSKMIEDTREAKW